MVNYSEMSDFEINKRVALALCFDLYKDGKSCQENHVAIQEGRCGAFAMDWCNNPADAWPIIEQSKLWMREIDGYWHVAGFHNKNSAVKYFDKKLFRAAMIVFLMMQDARNG